MKSLILLVLLVTLSGCAMFKQAVPVRQEFPNAIPELMKKCEELKSIQGDKIAITELLRTVVQNYSLYYECSNKVEGWQEWYNEQKKIFDSVK